MEQCLGEQGTLVFTITSNGYKELTYNLWLQLYRLQIPWTLLIVCLDRASYDYFQGVGFGGFKPAAMLLVDNKAGPSGGSQAQPAPFGSAQFKRLVELKLAALQQFCGDGRVRRLIYMDSDIMVRRDPVPRLLELLMEAPLWFQCDEGTVGSCRPGCSDACTGLIVMDCEAMRTELLELYAVVPKDWIYATSDQDYVQRRLQILGLTFRTLPRTEFPNGVYLRGVWGPAGTHNGVWRSTCLPPDLYLLHVNHCIGAEKQQIMRGLNAWIVP